MPRYKVWVMRRCNTPVLDDAFDLKNDPDCALSGEFNKQLRFKRPVINLRNAFGSTLAAKKMRFDESVAQMAFNSTVRRILSKEFNLQFFNVESNVHKGDICYSHIIGYEQKLILCLFESRKELFDEFYLKRYIKPVVSMLSAKYGYFDETVFVSLGGFVKEELSFAAHNDILLVDRNCFRQKRFGKYSIFVNRKQIEELRDCTIEENLNLTPSMSLGK